MAGVHKSAKNHMLAVNDRGYVVGEQHHRAKLTDHEVDLVIELLACGMSQRLVAEKMEVSRSTVRDIASGRTRGQAPTGWGRAVGKQRRSDFAAKLQPPRADKRQRQR